jgi:hypothetical protein
MQRVEYDPEIDPSIREEREAAERERELSARIRIEIERYAKEKEEKEGPPFDPDPDPDSDPVDPEKEREPDDKVNVREQRAREREEKSREKARRRAENAAGRRKAIQSVFTGNVLSSEWVRRMFPYLLGAAVLLLLYIGGIFHLQRLHRTRQRLEEQVRELSIEAVGYSAEKAQHTQRSAIVKRLEEKEIPLNEFPNPVKTVDGR